MKAFLFTAVMSLFLFTGCNNDAETNNGQTGNDAVADTSLPKGKSVIDDEALSLTTDNTTSGDPQSLNGLHSKKNNSGSKNTSAYSEKSLELARKYKNLFVFHAKDTMKIKKSYIATLILGKDQSLGSLKTEVLEISNAGHEDKVKSDTTIEISTKMKAKLISMDDGGDKNFEIEMTDPEAFIQTFTEKRKEARWSWKLTPLKPGQQNLALQISQVEEDGQPVTLPTKTIPIVIFAEKQSFLSQVGDFFTDTNTKWLVTAICIPILIAWFTTRMRHSHDIKAAQARADMQKNTAATADGTTVVQNSSTSEINKST